jgi:mRNA interferase MazF
MAGILRGEIRWADLAPTRGREQAGLRPVVILSQDVFNARSGTVIAVAVTSQPQRAGFPLTVELTSPRLPKKSWVKVSQIQAWIKVARFRVTEMFGGAVSWRNKAWFIAGCNPALNHAQIRTLAVERIGRRLGRVAPEELAQVIEGLNEIIGD